LPDKISQKDLLLRIYLFILVYGMSNKKKNTSTTSTSTTTTTATTTITQEKNTSEGSLQCSSNLVFLFVEFVGLFGGSIGVTWKDLWELCSKHYSASNFDTHVKQFIWEQLKQRGELGIYSQQQQSKTKKQPEKDSIVNTGGDNIENRGLTPIASSLSFQHVEANSSAIWLIATPTTRKIILGLNLFDVRHQANINC
jgi:hypothetical protein